MNKKDKDVRKIKIEKIDVIIFLIVILIFGIAWIGFSPAIMTSDCADQINQVRNGVYKNSHPVFHTFFTGGLARLFGTVSAPAIFQILVFATVWTWGCKVTRENNNSALNKAFQILFTTAICIIPINFMYSITLWKDILYTYSFLAMLICVYIGIKHNFKYSILQILLIALSCVCVMKFRHNGVPIGFLMFVIMAVLNFIKQKKIKFTVIFVVLFIIVYVLASIPGWVVLGKKSGVQTAEGPLTSTKIYLMGGLLKSDIGFEKQDLEFLNQILDTEEWKNCYNDYYGNGILFNANKDFSIFKTQEGVQKFDEIFNKYAKQKPFFIAKHFVAINSIWWSPYSFSYMNSVVLNNNDIHHFNDGEFDTNPKNALLNKGLLRYIYFTMNHNIIYIVLYRPAIPLLISLIGIIYVMVKTKKFSYSLIVLPMLLNIGTYVFIMSSQDGRYFYPNNITGYFVILIIAELICKSRFSKNKDKKRYTGRKTLVIVPAYNEEGAIRNTVNNIYKANNNVDVIVVNDGSKDNTYEEASKTNAIVIDAPSNLGIGGAVQTGYLYAYKNNYDIAIQVDGDGQHDPKYIAEMVDILSSEDIDMVIGSRFVSKTKYKQTFFRMLGINITSGLIQLFTDKKIHDTTSGFRAVNRGIIEFFAESYPYDYPEPVTTMQVILKNKKVKEIPVEMNQRTTGVSSISPLKSVSYMVKVSLSIVLNGFKKN